MKLKDKIERLLDSYDEYTMRRDLAELSAHDRLKMMATLAEYITPKMNRQEVKTDDGTINIRIIRE